MRKNIPGIILLIVGIAALVVGVVNRVPPGEQVPVPAADAEGSSVSRFAWRFENETASGSEVRTRVFLDVMYEDNTAISVRVDDVGGSCNEVATAAEDTDMVSGSTKIQCYAAGLGQWFKVVAGTNTYEVKRKTFEEALPNHTPPSYEYETVAIFPSTSL